MKIKRVEGVQQIKVISLKPEPQIYISYDGLIGLSVRPILRDILEEIDRGTAKIRDTKGGGGAVSREDLLRSLKECGSGSVHVYFSDYVSYGEGAGEEVAEFFFKTMLLLYQRGSESPEGTEKLLLQHAPGAVEELALTAN